MRYEKIILGCKKAPQVVWAWTRKSQTMLEKIVAIFCSYSGMAEIQNLAGDTEHALPYQFWIVFNIPSSVILGYDIIKIVCWPPFY